MKILIDEDVFEGSPSEIMERLWDQSFDPDEFPDLDSYMRYLQGNIRRMADIPCDLSGGTRDEKALALFEKLQDIDALEILEMG